MIKRLSIGFAMLTLLVSCQTPLSEDAKKSVKEKEPMPLAGEVVRVNHEYQYAVLRCAVLPSGVEEAIVYRGDVMVGHVKLTGPVHPPYIVADVLDGKLRIGDRVRNK
jgi:hypothetical protein